MKSAFLGPFDPTYSRSKSVDFSSMVSDGSYHFILPLKTADDPWAYLNPFDYEIWVFSLCITPIYILACVLTDHIFFHYLNWYTWLEFVLRNVLAESSPSYKQINRDLPHKKLCLYQSVLIVVWTWCCFILVKSYAGNLTAVIARPKLDMKFTKAEDFLYQDEIALTIEDGIGAIDYMSQSPRDSTMRKLIDKTERSDANKEFDDCFAKHNEQSGRHAAICDIVSIKSRLSKDFSTNGHCNWYIIEQKLLGASSVMVFQVGNVDHCLDLLCYNVFCRRGAHIWMMQMS